eukprot:TRINITY_DN68629_c0_g1_i1.p1 TRINITY_DN68629_c0_g1~~TRINITY_DN68629_c0_g1_i1.p1  ORF type:complete len:390 (+),score=73.31 TRINITY_DN68629_c0_g1_i1:82-1251(+)
MNWHMKCVVPVFSALVLVDAIQNETCAHAEIDGASFLQKMDKLAKDDRVNANYDVSCRPSQRPKQNSEPLLPPDVIEAGQKCILLMDVAYFLEHGPAIFAIDKERKLVEQFTEELTDITKAKVVDTGAFGMTAKWKGMFVVSMAGTNIREYGDRKADLKSVDARNIDLGGKLYSVGNGFADHYEGIRKILGPVFEKELKSPGTPVLVVGHSLGGAIANLAAVDLAIKYKARVRLVTAGSPRVFDSFGKGDDRTLKDSAKAVQEDLIVDGVGKESAANGYCVEPPPDAGKICTQRWVNYADPVPNSPPCSIGYFHVGNGALLINQPICLHRLGVKALTAVPQHQDYTSYTDYTSVRFLSEKFNHNLIRYYDRMLWAMEGKADDGRTAECR